MVFSTATFLYLFLPLVLLAHFLLPRMLRNAWLLVASLFFYACVEQQIVLLKLQRHTNEEIADQLACSERTVRRLLQRVQTRLTQDFAAT